MIVDEKAQPAMQVILCEPEPPIAIQVAGLLEVMLQQIQNHDLSSRTQNLEGGVDRENRRSRMVQRLAQDHQIHTLGIDWRSFQISQAKLEIPYPVLLRFVCPEGHHFFRVIDRDDFLGSARQQLRERAFACT